MISSCMMRVNGLDFIVKHFIMYYKMQKSTANKPELHKNLLFVAHIVHMFNHF